MINYIKAKSILNKHKKRDDWFLDDYSVNPYSGCAFNCIYCYIRGSKYGKNMAENLSVKINAPEILEKQLKRRANKEEYGIIALSTSTEPYQKIEKGLELTRKLLKIILKYRFPVHILTKSTLVLRDLDILKEIDKKAILPNDLKPKLKHRAIISFSISTLYEKWAKILEPGSPTPIERLKAIKECKEEGLMCGVSYIPVLPYISDGEEHIEEIIKTAKEYKSDFVFVGTLTLFGKDSTSCKQLYYKFLEKYHPEFIPRYKSLYRIFSTPSKEYQGVLEDRAKILCNKYKISYGITGE